MPNGDILPCRRLSVKIGNLKKDNLLTVYENNILLKKLRDFETQSKKCPDCFYKISCNGGLKCLSHAVLGDINNKDPNCWL